MRLSETMQINEIRVLMKNEYNVQYIKENNLDSFGTNP